MPNGKKAPRDPRGYLFHSILTPKAPLAPRDKRKSLTEKNHLYANISERLAAGLFPEDAVTALMNQIIQLSSDVRLPDETLSGWFREEARAYRREFKAGGFEEIMMLPDIPRPFEERMHDHFASHR